jgi:hypothetical protein
MLVTDIVGTAEGITTTWAFKDYAALYAYMVKHNIESCHVYATLACLQVTGTIEVTQADIKRILEENA